MADTTTTTAGSSEPTRLAGAFGAARELLDGAVLEAARQRSEADRYARQRENEAELLVQKARRLLYAAEEKAAVIVATARARHDQVIDLDALASTAVGGRGLLADDAGGIPPRLDDLLAAAISHAVTDAFAEPRPS